MKTTYLSFMLAAIICVAFLSCSDDEKLEPYVDGEKKFSFSNFDKLEVSGYYINVNLVQADSFSIRANGHAANVEDLHIYQQNDKLFIEYSHKHGYGYPTFITMTAPDLTECKFSDHAAGLFDLVGVPYLEVALLDESGVNLNGVMDTLSISVAEKSSLTLAGTGNKISAMVVGSSMLTAFDFPVDRARINVIDESYLEIHATDTLSISVDLESKAYYRGTPSIHSEVSGNSVFQPE